MEAKRFETAFEYRAAGCDVMVACSCGHTAPVDIRLILKTCIAKGLDTRMPAIKQRLRCKSCGGRDVQCSPVPRTYNHPPSP